LQHKAKITKDGYLKRPKLTEDGVEPAENADAVKAGTPFTLDLYEKLWNYHNEWTAAFFAEQDKSGSAGRFDRTKAGVIMDLLKKQLPSPRYIQHSARVLFIVGQANKQEREQLLEAIFDLSRDEIVKRVQAGKMSQLILAGHDYVFDIFPEAEMKKSAPSQETAAD
jgi:malate synthase